MLTNAILLEIERPIFHEISMFYDILQNVMKPVIPSMMGPGTGENMVVVEEGAVFDSEALKTACSWER